MGKIYCTECGAELDDSVKFCSSCGTPIDNKELTTTNKVTDNDSNDKPVENKEKSNKQSNTKYIAVSILVIIIIVILGFIFVTVTSPLYSADYTVDTSNYSITSEKDSRPAFDDDFKGSNVRFYDASSDGKIDVWHHGANGKDVDYYLKQYGNYDKLSMGNQILDSHGYDYGVKIKQTNNITVDGVNGYIMDGTWGLGYERTWVIFVHNDEYYLICFDGIDQGHQDKFLNSFKFKEN